MRGLHRKLLDLLLPQRCALCDAPTAGDPGLCAPCFSQMEFSNAGNCPGCARPLSGTVLGQAVAHCGICLRDGPMFDHASCALGYNSAASKIILQLKHGDRLDLAPLIASWMLMAWDQSDPPGNPDLIVPVPLHWRRLVARRYNQSLELCRHIAKRMDGSVIAPHLVQRRRHTAQMKNMNRYQRRQNVQGAFGLSARGPSITGKHIMLVDDVFTTGATLRAIRDVLRKAGVRHVSVLIAARVTRGDSDSDADN